MTTRREFLGSIALPTAAAAVAGVTLHPSRVAALSRSLPTTHADPETAAKDEDFWFQVKEAFTVDRSLINLNNGGVSPAPMVVQEAMKRHLDFQNSTPPPISLWQIMEPRKESVRERLAKQWGVDTEEIAITRNASESLQICQFGIDLAPGDEVITTTQDYPRMVATFKQRARREKIVFRQFKIPVPCEDPAQLVSLFEQNITPKTRLILASHIINITGQILPIKDIVAMARTKNGGIPVIIDGAHALAHFDFKLSDLGCDYYGVSLHKWLTAPIGTGLLYVRRDKIKSLWPLMAADEKLEDDIRKFEQFGTHPGANELAISEALTFHQAIGGPRKEARLRYLRDYWATRLQEIDSSRVVFHTPMKKTSPLLSCGIATVEILGLEQDKLQSWLWDKHKILTVFIKHDEFRGLRISPNVYTTTEELDRFVDAMRTAMTKGLPTT